MDFDKQLGRLRKLEEDLIRSGHSTLGINLTTNVLQAIALLKNDIYFLKTTEGNSALKRNPKYQGIKGEFPYLVDKVFMLVNEKPPQTVASSILDQVKMLHAQLTSIDQNKIDETTRLQKEITDLQRQVLASRMNVEEAQRVALAARSDVGEAKAAAVSANEAASVLVSDRMSQDWTAEYGPYINEDKEWRVRLDKRLKDNASKADKRLFRWCEKFYLVCFYRPTATISNRFFYEGKSYVNSSRRWRAWRSIWLAGLMLLAISYIWKFQSYDFSAHGIYEFLLAKTLFVPLVVVVSLAFIFSSRNYKINAHLLEQYQHRYVVARMMRSLVGLSELKDKSELLREGSKVLFEFRPTGYMSKVDSETSAVSYDFLASPFQKGNQKNG